MFSIHISFPSGVLYAHLPHEVGIHPCWAPFGCFRGLVRVRLPGRPHVVHGTHETGNALEADGLLPAGTAGRLEKNDENMSIFFLLILLGESSLLSG